MYKPAAEVFITGVLGRYTQFREENIEFLHYIRPILQKS